MNNLKQEWIDKTFKAIEDIDFLLSAKEDYRKDFVKLANWIYHTDFNPWGFMANGWEGAKGSAQGFYAFLCQLHHAMTDDGDLCFIETEIHGSFMAFAYWSDTECIKSIHAQKMGQFHGSGKYVVHTDVDRFIKHLHDHDTYTRESSERHEKRMQELMRKVKPSDGSEPMK